MATNPLILRRSNAAALRTMKDETNSKFTFGNILMAMLLAGTVGLIGLMYIVYREVSHTPERTTANQQYEQPAPPPQVEMLTPGGKPLPASAVTRDASLPQAQPPAASAPPAGFADSSLTEGAVPKKTVKKPKPVEQAEQKTPDNSGEVVLTPSATANSSSERRLQPVSSERTLQPEKPAAPRPQPAESRPSRPAGDAIGELF